MTRSLRGRASVVGIGEVGVGHVGGGVRPLELLAKAARKASADAGISLQDVDGLFATTAYHPMAPMNVAEYLGIRPTYSDGTNVGGSSFINHLQHAAAALDAGLCNVALICYGSTQRSDSGKLVSSGESSPYETPFNPRLPVSAYALAAARHMHEYGTSRSHLAEVAVAARQWAQMNPAATEQEPLTLDEALGARMVSSPLTVRDCCLVTDGAGAVILTRADRAADTRYRPAHLLGVGSAHWHRNISAASTLTTTSATDSGRAAFTIAGLSPADVDHVMLYDAFTINTILFLEDLGFCRKGEGGDFVTAGRIAPGGSLPVNTNGGGLSFGHPGMYGIFLIIEAVRQLRGTAGRRQVPDTNISLVHGNGSVLSHQSTALLGSSAAI